MKKDTKEFLEKGIELIDISDFDLFNRSVEDAVDYGGDCTIVIDTLMAEGTIKIAKERIVFSGLMTFLNFERYLSKIIEDFLENDNQDIEDEDVININSIQNIGNSVIIDFSITREEEIEAEPGDL